MAGRLDGRVAVITGAGGGIGRATASLFAAEGAVVVVNDLVAEKAEETVALITGTSGRAEAQPGDVTDSAFVDGLVDGTLTRHGRLDVFHSNAGFGHSRLPLASISDDVWRADLELNITSMFFCIRAAIRVMTAQGTGGSIVCTSSASALATVANIAPYGSAKAALLQLVRAAAVEYGPSGIRVNAVIPGATRTPAFDDYIGTPERLATYEQQIPLGRMNRPEDIANAVLWLASDESATVTGTSIIVDGGVTAKRAEPEVPQE